MSEFENIEIWGEKDKTSSSAVGDKGKQGAEKEAAVASTSSDSNKSLLYGVAGVFFLGVLAVGAFLLVSGGGDSSDSANAEKGSSENNGSETDTGEGALEGDSPLELAYRGEKAEDGLPLLLSDTLPYPDSAELIDKVKGDGSAWIVADQKGMRFKLSGEVPDEASKEAIETSLKQTWRAYGKSEITVNESLEGGPWLQDMPGAIKNVAIMGSETSMAVNNSKVYLDGDVRDDSYTERFVTVLSDRFENLPEIENNLIKTGQVDQTLDINVEGGKATLKGFAPSQGMVDTIEYFLHEQYGPENVTNLMEVSDNVAPGILTLGFDGNIKVFSAFSSHRLEVAFNEKAKQAQFNGAITSGIAFEPGSTNLSPTLTASLEGFIALSNRTGRPIQIIGHTDTDGDATFNLELSKKRAEEVKKAFLALDFPEERLNTFGRGEEQPLVEEKTEADKKLNRRVEIILGELKE